MKTEINIRNITSLIMELCMKCFRCGRTIRACSEFRCVVFNQSQILNINRGKCKWYSDFHFTYVIFRARVSVFRFANMFCVTCEPFCLPASPNHTFINIILFLLFSSKAIKNKGSLRKWSRYQDVLYSWQISRCVRQSSVFQVKHQRNFKCFPASVNYVKQYGILI